jgi:hypothetical protein
VSELAVVARRAAEIVRAGWCQHAVAVNELGTNTDALDPRATKHCALGALAVAASDPDAFMHPIADRIRRMTGCSIGGWNDMLGQTQAEVAALFDRIAAEEEQSAARVAGEEK